MIINKYFSQAFLCLLVVSLLSSCNSCNNKEKTIDPAFSAYISAYTSGTISSEASIRIRLSNDIAKENEFNQAIDKNLFDFSPSIKGQAVWIDSRTIEFRPSEKLPSGQQYQVTFLLKNVMDVPEKFNEFVFEFRVIQQSFEVKVDGLKPLDNINFYRQMLLGVVNTADVEDPAKVEQTLTATQNGKVLPVRWMHDGDRMTHSFTIDSIIRGEDSSFVLLSWDGKAMDVELKGEQKINVPALGDFSLIDAQIVQDETKQYILIRFSDPLLQDQNLDGLITLGGMTDMRLLIEDNTIMVYPTSRQTSSLTLVVNAGVKNILGKPLKADASRIIEFQEIKPSVRLLGKGVILPDDNGLVFPFEAVNLNAVDVRIVKVYENNMGQFLQVNDLDGQSELTRVGRVVLQKAIPLATLKQTDFTKWNRFALDLSDLIKTEPGALYRITLSFRKKYSLYQCLEQDSTIKDEDNMQSTNENWDSNEQKEYSYWDYADDYYNNGDEDYQWSNRDNPCKREYYSPSRWVSRNVFASNLGIIAKKGMEGSLFFAVTDLNTTEPLSGVSLELYNYQHQLIKETETNSSGEAEVNLSEKPFFLLAKKGDQRGYLKLDDGSSLSLSMFDVAGEKVEKGIKGFIYGERGVWRPGDSLFVMFVLEDKQKSLPENHPVSFELINPMGQMAKKIIKTESVNGFYSFQTATDETAPTGNWEARVKVGGATFSKNIRIETIMPNRLKIKFDFAKKYLSKDDGQSAKMEVLWLHGAIARNLKAEVEVSMTSSQTTFPKYTEFIFDDPTRKFSMDKQVLFDDNIDENGKATVNANIEVEDGAPGMLMANFNTKVFEPGGSFSSDRFSIPYHPYDSYVGIRLPKGDKARGILLTDTNHIVQIVSVDKSGSPTIGKKKIEIEFYKISWRWWWDKSEEDLTNYAQSSYFRILKEDTITTNNGQGSWKLRLAYPEWGRYLVLAKDLETGHRTGKIIYMDWPGWAGRAQKDQSAGASMLSFSSDKEKYAVGEEAVLTIPSSKNGRALISVESGTKVLKSYWMEGQEGQTQFKIPITPDMAPNVYVNVSMLQPHSQTVNDLPIRMYGVIPILVEDPNTHLHPSIKMPDVLRPEEAVNITVKEDQGKEMTYTIAVVDEGLLDITRYKTPDPWENFYAREALGVKTWDMFDMVMGAWGAQLERILSIGGDEGLNKPKEGKKANRFKPVVKFMGPFHLNKGESQTHSFIMPQYIGSVKTMVIAGQDGAYGFADKATPVRKPIMVLATLPRVLGPDETVELPISVFAMEKNIKDVNVQIVANDMFEVIGEKSKMVKFTQPGDELVTFNLKVKSKLGIASVKILASSGKEKAETNIELDVRNPNAKVVQVIDTVLEVGQNWQTNYKPLGMAGTNKVTLEVSNIPSLNLGKRLDYLIHYPYGCVEQTTSSVFPQLYLTDLMDISPDKKAKIENNIKAGIDRLRQFQVPSGGISYWPGESEASEWGTNYAGHFLLEAELKGYSLPAGYIDQWKKYQKAKAASYVASTGNYDHPHGHESYELIQAYRLYTLALAKSPDLGSMNRMRENKNLSQTALWSLAAAYQLAGQPEVANQLIANLSTDVKDYQELSDSYGSDERDESIILETLSLMGKRDKAAPVMKALSKSLCSKDWMSTQTTAYTLLAMAKYVGKAGLKSELNFAYHFNTAADENVVSQLPVKQVEMNMKGAQAGNLSMKNKGKGILYARIIVEGIPKTGDQISAENNLNMKVVYKELGGKEIAPDKITQGTDFYVEVSLTNPNLRSNYSEMALSQIFPSGWEILNTRLDNAENTSDDLATPRYQDIRDDRVYTFFDLKAKETKTFRIYLNASYLGNYYLPAIYSETMYDASINARQAGKWVSVVREESAAKSLSTQK